MGLRERFVLVAAFKPFRICCFQTKKGRQGGRSSRPFRSS
jgi:hypothetical protein